MPYRTSKGQEFGQWFIGWPDPKHFAASFQRLIERELAWLKDDPVFSDLFSLNKPRGFSSVRKLRIAPAKLPKLRVLLDGLEAAYRRGDSRFAILGRLLLILDFIHVARDRVEAPDFSDQGSHPAIHQAVEPLPPFRQIRSYAK